jgi:3-deoxy-D-manno-octulosonate 8-phosphate phosphatase (KDO 8-P phosphatase)
VSGQALPADLAPRLRAVRLAAFDFDGVFTDNGVYVFEDGREAVRCDRGDGLGLARLKQLGLHLIILSTEVNPVVTARARKLGVRCLQGLTDKGSALQTAAAELGLAREQVAYLGNDVNDRDCLEWAGVPVVVQDAHADVAPLGLYQTRRPGGHGAVRELCDLLVAAQEARAAP